jgi:PAS domain-containing protein
MNKPIIDKLVRQSPRRVILEQVVALFLLALMIVLELDTVATISPLMSMVCFIYFAHRMRAGFVSFWVFVFSTTSLVFLYQPGSANLGTVYIRFGTLLAGGIGAVIISHERTRIRDSLLQTIRILEKLPTPVIVSDCEGCVVFMNNDALQLLDVEADQVHGTSYFSFVAGEAKGQMIQKYFEFVDAGRLLPLDIVLQLKKPTVITTHATLVLIDGLSTKLLATVFSLPSHDRERAKTREIQATVDGHW